jgi:hypothetical protein
VWQAVQPPQPGFQTVGARAARGPCLDQGGSSLLGICAWLEVVVFCPLDHNVEVIPVEGDLVQEIDAVFYRWLSANIGLTHSLPHSVGEQVLEAMQIGGWLEFRRQEYQGVQLDPCGHLEVGPLNPLWPPHCVHLGLQNIQHGPHQLHAVVTGERGPLLPPEVGAVAVVLPLFCVHSAKLVLLAWGGA